MDKRFTKILIRILVALFCITATAEAQTMENGRLNVRQEAIVPIAAFTANGDLDRLKTSLNEGLDAGLTINEIKEILVQMYAYAGFPRSLNGINTFMAVLDERQKKGIRDVAGKEPTTLPDGRSSIELGTEIQTRLVGKPVSGPTYTFAPVIDRFLKGHLFGDIFGRDNLDFQSRELATISALASMEGVGPQLQAHVNVGLNVGLTEVQLRSLVAVLDARVGKKEAGRTTDILEKVFAGRQAEQAIAITRSSSQATVQGPADRFTGSVAVTMLFTAHEPSRTTGGQVTFQPGARTAWHSHPLGQTLIVTAGTGLIQRWGGPIEEMRPGDVVRIPAGVKHWHGASPTTAMTHIAIQESLNGTTADWMEQVSDEQYRGTADTP